jgi:chorismate-pyruvate lyase
VIPLALLLVQADPAESLRQELRSSRSATAVLQRRCGEPIRAVVDRAGRKPPTPEQRAHLAVGPAEPVTYRSVVLKCGGLSLSIAENWYVPARLTPEMNAALAGDTPFGAVIRPLAPSRRTLGIATQGEDAMVAPYVLRQRALVIGGDGRPLSEVVENYTPELIGLPVRKP